MNNNNKKHECKVFYLDLYGTRNEKLEFLQSHSMETTPWQELQPQAPSFFFVPKDFSLQKEYEKGIKIDELFRVYNSGLCTEKDNMNIFFEDTTRMNILNDLQTLDLSTLCGKYDLKPEWAKKAQEITKQNEIESKHILYRPFDSRYTNYYAKQGLMARPRYDVMQHMIRGENVGLIAKRGFNKDCNTAMGFITNTLIDRRAWTCPGMQGAESLFPLYLYDEEGERHLNMKTELIGEHTPEDFFAYIYAVLHSPTYRERYKEFLKIDFPRIPLPTDTADYQRLVGFGKELIDLHLMRATLPMIALPKYPIAGSNMVETLRYEEGKVYINNTQYFEGVSETAWAFFIGGYQPAQKWLKDRKARTLSLNDIRHYQRMIATLDKTAEIMKQIG